MYHACVILAEECGFLLGSLWVIVQTWTQRTYFNAVTCFQGMKHLCGEVLASSFLKNFVLFVTSVCFQIWIYVPFRSWLVLCSNKVKYCTGPGLYSIILVIFETTLCSSHFFSPNITNKSSVLWRHDPERIGCFSSFSKSCGRWQVRNSFLCGFTYMAVIFWGYELKGFKTSRRGKVKIYRILVKAPASLTQEQHQGDTIQSQNMRL